MAFKDLREYLEKVQELGELREVEGAEWDLEIGAIADMVAGSSNPSALLFDRIKGSPAGFRVATNLFVSPKRMALVLGLPVELRGIDLVKALCDKMEEGFKAIPPKNVATGPVLENVLTGEEVDLLRFPTPRWHELDGGRYIGTGCAIIVKDPDEGWVNLGTHRVEVQDRKTLTIFMVPGQHGDIIRKKYWAKGQGCPTAVLCGQDPSILIPAGIKIPWGVSEYDYAGWWRNEAIEVVRGPATGLPIPASAEIVLEGEIVPPEVETRVEGPFGEWPGYYASYTRPEPAVRVKSILHRNDPIILGLPPYIPPGIAPWVTHIIRAASLWSELKRHAPGITGVWQPYEFGSRTAVVISVKQEYPGHAKQVASLANGCSTIAHNLKYIIVVDDDIDPSNLTAVLFAVGQRTDPESAIDIISGTWATQLDPALTPQKRQQGDITHSTAIIMACKPYHWINQFPKSIVTSQEWQQRVTARWGHLFDPAE